MKPAEWLFYFQIHSLYLKTLGISSVFGRMMASHKRASAGPKLENLWPTSSNLLISHYWPYCEQVMAYVLFVLDHKQPRTGQALGHIQLPVPTHYSSNEQNCPNPDPAASTGPVEIFCLTSDGLIMVQIQNG